MVNNMGKYYLVCNYDYFDELGNYKIEKITNIKIVDEVSKPIEQVKGYEKGNENTPFEVHKQTGDGDWFYFREVFHDEHMVTIDDIINELLSLKDINEENVVKVLDKIYICRMLKSEDRKLFPKRHRSTNLDEVKKNL